jgi:uncharacterized membrane protein
MTEVIAIAFDDERSADDVLNKLRGVASDHPVELDDACIVQRDEGGRLHLKQAIGHGISDALHAQFWHELVHHILHHGAMDDVEGDDHCRLDRDFCCHLAAALKPGTSALFVLLRHTQAESLVEALERHRGRILRSTLPEHERAALEVAVGMRPPPAPPASALRALLVEEQEHTAEEAQEKRQAAEARRREEIERVRRSGLAPEDIRAILQRCTDAARAEHEDVVAYRFPSEVCSDGGRAINNGNPDWPASLTGQPRAVYDYWQSVLRPAGYRFRARILDYPRGMPGNAGLILSWGTAGG